MRTNSVTAENGDSKIFFFANLNGLEWTLNPIEKLQNNFKKIFFSSFQQTEFSLITQP